jgi:glycerol uptake facilitator-like aquaporin
MDTKKYAAEAIGTFWLTFAGCGSAVIAAGFPQVGIGLVGVSFAFGLSVVTMGLCDRQRRRRLRPRQGLCVEWL